MKLGEHIQCRKGTEPDFPKSGKNGPKTMFHFLTKFESLVLPGNNDRATESLPKIL